MRTWVVDLKGFGHVATIKVEAETEDEAKAKAAARYGISVEVRNAV
jgi:hypothetical protein